MRNPIDRLTDGLPKTLARSRSTGSSRSSGAILIVLAIKQWVVNPYRIPSSSMEPTLHCARPGAAACEGGLRLRPRARVPLLLPLLEPEARRHRRLQHAARGARSRAAPGGTFVKRLIGLPGRHRGRGARTASSRSTARSSTSRTSSPPTSRDNTDYRAAARSRRAGTSSWATTAASSCDSRRWGSVPREQPDRQGLRHLLAARAGSRSSRSSLRL